MKTIGLIGGMSWESTLHYYRLINQGVKRRLGGLHSARILLASVDFAPIAALQAAGDWDQAGAILAGEAAALERAGADFLVLCTNTMHRVAAAIGAGTSLPLVHIAEPTAAAIAARGIRRVGLLGTRFTMEEPFYRERLRARHGLDVRVPGDADRALVHRVIYDELCQGVIAPASRDQYRRVAGELVAAGAEGVIFGCTEIGSLLDAYDVAVPTFDTTALHAAAAVDLALADLPASIDSL
ncbi:MAG TPA: aspartate/glutamate racemase family protein [Kofleriaceae bacterium]|nr:aspartate/glutamate racemase family protein [Kofleriaceae bacterium]